MRLINSTRKVDRKKLLGFICGEPFFSSRRGRISLLTIFTSAALATAGVQCRQWRAGKCFNHWLSGGWGCLSILTAFDHCCGVNIPSMAVFRLSAGLYYVCDRDDVHRYTSCAGVSISTTLLKTEPVQHLGVF